MADPTRPGILLHGWRRRLAARWPVLVAVATVLVLLVGLGEIGWAGALSLFVLAVAIAGLVGESEGRPASAPANDPSADDAELRLFADALPDPCLLLDARSVVVHRNPPAATQFPGVVLGNPLALSLRAPALLGAIDAARASGEARIVDLHQTVPTETWHTVTVAPLVPAHGGGVLVVTLRSRTDEKRLEALRTDFIANASHELRTPLTSVLGFIDTLDGPAAKDPAAQKRFLEIMRGQAVRMSRLIDDLLSLSRIEMRQHVRPTGSVDLSGLLREVREGLSAQAADASLTVAVSLPDEPVLVTGDREELYEVFENLLDNAIKYGADGGSGEVSLRAANRSGYDWLVEVVDHGAGVAPEHVPRLTERFYRVDAESSRRKKGTGLGLAIVKHILTRHRGLMTIRSTPGKGTRVEVYLSR